MAVFQQVKCQPDCVSKIICYTRFEPVCINVVLQFYNNYCLFCFRCGLSTHLNRGICLLLNISGLFPLHLHIQYVRLNNALETETNEIKYTRRVDWGGDVPKVPCARQEEYIFMIWTGREGEACAQKQIRCVTATIAVIIEVCLHLRVFL